MRNSAWVVLSLLLVVSLAAPGCRRKSKDLAGEGDYLAPIEDGYSQTDLTAGRGDQGTIIEGLNLAPVYFAFDSFMIGPEEISKVQAAATYLHENPAVRCVIEGHSDERGTHEYNMALGQSRADAVRAAIVDAGIDSARVESKSLGEEKPFSPDHDEAGYSLNRRGEFLMYQ